jgi:hypothetical protein
LEFFTGQINNDHTRRAYMNATRRFATWCASNAIDKSLRTTNFTIGGRMKSRSMRSSGLQFKRRGQMPPKGHHFIPRLYLQYFVGNNPKGQVLTYDAQTGRAWCGQ